MPETSAVRSVRILIAEDDDGHAELIRSHLEDAGIVNPIQGFGDGLQLWNFLSRTGPPPHRAAGQAYLLLLDIQMPKLDGVEVLRRVKKTPELRSLPVIMLTTTGDPREVHECYALGCNSYVTKPVDPDRFSRAIRTLGLFISIVQVDELNGETRDPQ